MHESTAAMSVPINGEEIEVPGIPHLACPRCDNTLTWFADVEALHLAALAIYRERHGLLAATEIRALRVRRQLTQARLAALLRLGTNTISRWEAGRNVQSASMDVLLRLVRDVPGTLEYLRRHPA
jgi:putative zinc finger/helix-turn-helix YgiT family protein